MMKSDLYQIEAPLDPFDALLEAVEAAIHASNAFLDMGHANFHILHISHQDVDALLNTRETRLDLLQHGHDDVSDFAHTDQSTCSRDVPQYETEVCQCP